jgi:hypothetical protein
MVCNVLAVAFYNPLQPIFDFAESAHAAKYARRIGHFPARNAALLVCHRQDIPALISPQKPHSVTDLPRA